LLVRATFEPILFPTPSPLDAYRAFAHTQVAMTWGCVNDEERFAGRVENNCLDGGSWYLDACGPRTSFLTDAQWATQYTIHRDFGTDRAQEFAGRFEQLAQDSGGGANGFAAQRIADAWFKRDVGAGGVGGPDQAAPFFRRVCEQMRIEYPEEDMGPGSTSEAEGSMKYLVGGFLYKVTAPCPICMPQCRTPNTPPPSC